MKILIIQTAFIGDVILATPIIEKLNSFFPSAKIDFLLNDGNQEIFKDHPHISKIHVWKKRKQKYRTLFKILKSIRDERYDYVVNIHRFLSSGIITAFSKAKTTLGFKKNPLSFLFTKRIPHNINKGTHETERNLKLIENLTDNKFVNPKLYPSKYDFQFVEEYKTNKYICIAPNSIWFTKQLPSRKWIQLINNLDKDITIYLVGAENDAIRCNKIITNCKNSNVKNLCGKLSILQSAALLKDAEMNYGNDSALIHIASSINAPITAIFCSTITDFGFGPLSTNSTILETKKELKCRPCGLHGLIKCPKGHFKCAEDIEIENILL